MRSVTADQLEALSGSRGLETASITVWYDGRPVAVDVPLESWSLTADEDREVNATLSYTVVDPDGTLAPWSHTDTLGRPGTSPNSRTGSARWAPPTSIST